MPQVQEDGSQGRLAPDARGQVHPPVPCLSAHVHRGMMRSKISIKTLHVEFDAIVSDDSMHVTLSAFAPPSGLGGRNPAAGKFYLGALVVEPERRPEVLRALAQQLVLHELDELIIAQDGTRPFEPDHSLDGSQGEARLSPIITAHFEETIRADERVKVLAEIKRGEA